MPSGPGRASGDRGIRAGRSALHCAEHAKFCTFVWLGGQGGTPPPTMSPMPQHYDESLKIPLRSPQEVEDRVRDLVGSAIVRKVWLLFLDESDVQLPIIMPIEDLPDAVPEDHALVPLMSAMREVASAVIVVLERPGERELSDSDRGWVRSLSADVQLSGLRAAGLLLSHSAGVRWLSPDDWI